MLGHTMRARIVTATSSFCLAISLAAGASAQGTDADKPKEADAGDIVITGSRIAADVGMKAATPVTAVSTAELTALSRSHDHRLAEQAAAILSATPPMARGRASSSSPGEGKLNLRGLNTGR